MKSLIAAIIAITSAGVVRASATNHASVALNTQASSSQSQTNQSVGFRHIQPDWPNSQTNPGQSGSTPTPGSNVTTASATINTTVNWAGYSATGGTFTGVTGSWVAPSPSGSGATSADATWVGIGGVTSNDLIQVGTQNEVLPNGTVQTSVFYETLPDTSQDISSVTINPGDSVSASITETSPNEWTIRLIDNTNGSSFATNVAYDSSLSSAEWIEEEPSYGSTQEMPLDNFGTVSFTSGGATEDGNTVSITGSQAQALTMVNQANQVLASTSALGNDGNSFSVTRSNATSAAAISQFNQYPGRWSRRGTGIGRPFGVHYRIR
jgi:hypothetical protein